MDAIEQEIVDRMLAALGGTAGPPELYVLAAGLAATVRLSRTAPADGAGETGGWQPTCWRNAHGDCISEDEVDGTFTVWSDDDRREIERCFTTFEDAARAADASRASPS